MNALSKELLFADAVGVPVAGGGYMLNETYWGYVIRAADDTVSPLGARQAVAGLCGAVSALFALVIWAGPAAMLSVNVPEMRIALSVFFLGLALMLVRYATRGDNVELEIDTKAGELREVVRNRAGRPSLLGRWDFSEFGGVFVDRSSGDLTDMGLMLRYRNTSTVIEVARGPLARVESLRDRIGRDLLDSQAGAM